MARLHRSRRVQKAFCLAVSLSILLGLMAWVSQPAWQFLVR